MVVAATVGFATTVMVLVLVLLSVPVATVNEMVFTPAVL